jgi:Bacterial mobilisation protein (MobC)
MGATEVLTTRITPEIKEQVAGVVREEFLTESTWLRRLVLREPRVSGSDQGPRHRGNASIAGSRGGCSDQRAPGSSLYVRLRPEDRVLLRERAAARGMASATYVSVLVRSHLRSLAPLPKDELFALKRAVSELGAVGRNLNQIARAANQGARGGGMSHDDVRAILKICAALRDHTKGLIKANAASWSTGHAEP